MDKNNKNFDLFKLHDTKLDIGSKSWICFYGKNLYNIFDKLVNEIQFLNNINKNILIKLIAKKLNCSKGPPTEILYNRKKFVPLPIIIYLLSFVKNKDYYKNEFIKSTQFIKCNNANSKPIKAVKKLTVPLCKIAGAHAGDGNLYTKCTIEIKDKITEKAILSILKKKNCKFNFLEINGRRRIEITIQDYKELIIILNKFRKSHAITFSIKNAINIADFYQSNLEAYKSWLLSSFGIEIKINNYSKKNAYRIDIDNKIIARYLNKFLLFPYGEKTFIVKEPKIITKSTLKFRKAFLLGYVTFEGHVKKTRNSVQVSSKSCSIIKTSHSTFRELNIPMRKIHVDGYKRWICISKELNRNSLEKALSIFEYGTEKWERLQNKIENA